MIKCLGRPRETIFARIGERGGIGIHSGLNREIL